MLGFNSFLATTQTGNSTTFFKFFYDFSHPTPLKSVFKTLLFDDDI
jgi:hypothetical protein